MMIEELQNPTQLMLAFIDNRPNNVAIIVDSADDLERAASLVEYTYPEADLSSLWRAVKDDSRTGIWLTKYILVLSEPKEASSRYRIMYGIRAEDDLERMSQGNIYHTESLFRHWWDTYPDGQVLESSELFDLAWPSHNK